MARENLFAADPAMVAPEIRIAAAFCYTYYCCIHTAIKNVAVSILRILGVALSYSRLNSLIQIQSTIPIPIDAGLMNQFPLRIHDTIFHIRRCDGGVAEDNEFACDGVKLGVRADGMMPTFGSRVPKGVPN